jgi:hypothetical protein
VPRLCGVYPGICLTTEEKARKNLSQGSQQYLEAMGRASVVPREFMRSRILTSCNTYAACGPAKWSVQWLTTWAGRFLIFIFVWQLEHVIGTKVLNSLCLYRWKIIQAQEFLSFWEPSQRQPATKNICKPEAAITVFELLMMSGVSPENMLSN